MTADSSTPAHTETVATEKPSSPPEPPFTTDVLISCTSRFTRRAWDIFLAYKRDPEVIKTCPIRGKLIVKTESAAGEISDILRKEGSVTQLTQRGKEIELTATFAAIQLVIKHPQTVQLDAVKI